MSQGTVHVGAYERQGPHGVIHVAAHERGGGSGRAWERKPNAAFRQRIAEAERSAEQINDGYGERHPGGALGRYQITPITLDQAGWKIGGTWTDKAREHGVTSDDDFRTNPEAQEAAMSDIMREAERQADAKGLYRHSGQTYPGVVGQSVTITDAGIAEAAHREGADATRKYLQRRVNGRKADAPADRERDRRIEKRLRDFEKVPYTRGNW